MIELDTAEIRFALKAARQAALLVKDIQVELAGKSITKEDKSPVTIADFASQALVSHLLQAVFPGDVLVGEEDAGTLLNSSPETLDTITKFIQTRIQKITKEQVTELINYGSGKPASRFWTLDPIDGTKGFLRGEQYAVAFALLVNYQVEIGVLACPNLTDGSIQEIGGAGSLVVAQRGKGTWTTDLTGAMEFTRLEVSKISDPAQARFLRSFEAGHTNVSQLDEIGMKMGVQAEPVRLDSQAKYSILAAGAGDALFRLISAKMPDYKEKIWDQAAGSIICEEAGGRVSDLDGKALDFSQGRTLANNRGILASNGLLHDIALAAIKSVGA
ncbi:3'(2'),5'-bisphosphate nucleotidase [bacterium]|nr:3'(2'),5'-bisphosphate nucleotidase [bacterium]